MRRDNKENDSVFPVHAHLLSFPGWTCIESVIEKRGCTQ